MSLSYERYETQRARWPASGRHILAQYDAERVVVYQAYDSDIADYALAHQHFGGAYSFSRMSWVKTNFLWMMYRSGWGTKPRQERTLAISLHRGYFDELLVAAVASSFRASRFEDLAAWQQAGKRSDVRLQWDPDHGPSGAKRERRAIQLGVRGAMQARQGPGGDAILGIEDLTEFVARERPQRGAPELLTPRETVYPVGDPKVAERLGISTTV